MRLTEIVKNESGLDSQLASLSQQHGGAWIALVKPFTHEVQFIQFQNPSNVPDHYHDLTQNTIAYKGKLRGFTKAAIIREQNRGIGRG